MPEAPSEGRFFAAPAANFSGGGAPPSAAWDARKSLPQPLQAQLLLAQYLAAARQGGT